MIRLIIMAIVVCTVATIGCKKNDGDGTDSFNRSQMLEDVSSRIIIPSYTALKAATDNLSAAFAGFKAAPSNQTLTDLQQAFLISYTRWQDCAAFEFGPAMDEALRGAINIFPTSTQVIEDNISSGTYNLGAASNVSAR